MKRQQSKVAYKFRKANVMLDLMQYMQYTSTLHDMHIRHLRTTNIIVPSKKHVFEWNDDGEGIMQLNSFPSCVVFTMYFFDQILNGIRADVMMRVKRVHLVCLIYIVRQIRRKGKQEQDVVQFEQLEQKGWIFQILFLILQN